jgi:uncharacterized coiled-coil protein SlyX
MDILKELSPILQLIISLGSLFALYLKLNNSDIKQESRITELEKRFERKDKYDDELRNDVKKLMQDVTKITTNLEILISHEKETRRNNPNP